MKMQTRVRMGIAALALIPLLAITQTPDPTTPAPDPITPGPTPPVTITPVADTAAQAAARLGIVFVDARTFAVVGPGTNVPPATGANAPERIEQRRRVAMQLFDPEGYAKLYPLTDAQQSALQQSLFEGVDHDLYVARARAQKTPAELDAEAALKAELDALFFHPAATPAGPPPEPVKAIPSQP